MTTSPSPSLAAATAAFPDAATPALPPRHDLYVSIHKALRHFMLDTLMRVGSLEVRDEAEMDEVLGQLDALLVQCREHIAHENGFIHPVLDACRAGASSRIAEEHEEHHEHIDALRHDARELRAESVERRPALALRLYRHLALFVADNFRHMHHEETVHNAMLWSHYSDAQLEALHGQLLASLPPQEVFLVSRWMIPAMTPRERVGMLGGVRANAPEGVFTALVDHVRPHLDERAWSRLGPDLGLDPAMWPATR